MKDIVIVGAGKIGSMIAEFLGGSGDYAVTVIDRSQQQLDRLETSAPVKKAAIALTHSAWVSPALWAFLVSYAVFGAVTYLVYVRAWSSRRAGIPVVIPA